MKKVILLTILFILPPVWAQNGPGRDKRHFSKRFQELEKIKLLEILELDEETTLKFFSRRNQAKKNMEEIMKKSDDIYDKIEKAIAGEGNEDEYDSLIEDAMMIEKGMMSEKSKFIHSLNDILTRKQVLKFVLFERKFKRDVRDLLIEKGRRKFNLERFSN
jgi:hypothetical protein